MSTKHYLEDGDYIENFLDDGMVETDLSESHYEEERWVVVESENKDFLALIDSEGVYDTLDYENEEELEQAVLEGDEARGRYPATELDKGAMIYDREDGSTFIKSEVSASLEETI